jgi:hypothetical protein
MQRTRSRASRAVASCLSIVTACAAIGLGAPRAFADGDAPSDQDKNKAIATDLFDRGVKLMAEGKCADGPADAAKCKQALDSFRRAYQIYPAALGALRNAAYIEKGLGMIASAARDFREVARKAPLDPKPERQAWAEYARKEADELSPRIPHLIVSVPADAPKGTKVVLDGTALAEPAWGTSLDVDPGTHSIHAEAPGRATFESRVSVAEKETKTFAIVLDADTSVAPPTTTSRGSITAPLIVSGIGLVGVGVGLGFGYAAMKKKDDACGGTKLCDPSGLDDGRKLANTSSIVTGVGAAVLVGGLVWLLVTPSRSAAPAGEVRGARIVPFVSDRSAGLAAFGTF